MEDNKKPFDAGDETSVEKRKTLKQLQKELEDEQLKQILDTKAGRAFFWRLLQYCRVFSTTFSPGLSDQSAFNEGMRNVGLKVLKDIITLDKKLYNLMTNENQKDKNDV
jgi:hypothetical protein